MTTTTTRWERLERYARWKSGRLCLDRLPEDVLGYLIQHFLTVDDLDNLLTARTGRRPSLARRADLALVPEEVRGFWVGTTMLKEAHAHLFYRVAEVALYHARDVQSVVCFSDWSPFAVRRESGGSGCSVLPMPVAEYCWGRDAQGKYVANVHVYERRLEEVAKDCVRRQMPVVHLSLYAMLPFPTPVLCPNPLYMTEMVVFPHFLLRSV